MSNLVQQGNNELITFSEKQKDLIKSQICKGATDDELQYFMYVCQKTGLDPFARQIYAIQRKAKVNGEYRNVMSIQTGIDGYRLVAHRTNQCLSISDPVFEFADKSRIPISATVTVEKIINNHIGKFTATAYWDEYYADGKSYMANSKPRTMLGKSAESIALRKAFPAELSALRTKEEMVMADIDEIKTIADEKIVTDKKIIDYDQQADHYTEIVEITTSAWPSLTETQRMTLMQEVLCVNRLDDLKKDKQIDLTKQSLLDYLEDTLK